MHAVTEEVAQARMKGAGPFLRTMERDPALHVHVSVSHGRVLHFSRPPVRACEHRVL